MAASIRKVTRLFLQDKRLIYTICMRNSRYDTSFVENTTTLDAIKQPVEEDDVRRFSKIKAARTDDHTFTDFDPLVQKFTNMVLKKGKKDLARDIMDRAFEYVKRAQLEKYHKSSDAEKTFVELDAVAVFYQALENGKPLLITKRIRKGGQIYHVPVAASEIRQNFLTMKWMIDVCKEKDRSLRFHDKLGQEIIDAYNNRGGLIRKKQDMHRICDTNKAFAYLA